MTKTISTAAIAALMMLGGCATIPQPTREEFLNATTREFRGVTKEQALSAAERLFRLADGDDFRFSHTQDSLLAQRNWMAYAVIAAASGTDFWQVTATPLAEGVRVSAQVSVSASGMSAYMASTTRGGSVAVPFTTPANTQPYQGLARAAPSTQFRNSGDIIVFSRMPLTPS